MNRRDFGQVVETLRRQGRRVDPHGNERQWSQDYLAEEMEQIRKTKYVHLKPITKVQVARIERGEVINLYNYVGLLAEAFGLNEVLKTQFYSAAGYVYPGEEKPYDKDRIEGLMRRFHYPSHCLNPVWDMIGFSAYNYVLYRHTSQNVDMLRKGELRSNLLRILFDPIFSRKEAFGSESQWQDEMLRNLRAFRASALPYLHTKRYKLIIATMYREYRDFRKLWEMSLDEPVEEEELYVRPWTTILDKSDRKLTFMTFRLPEEYLGQKVYIYGYLPTADTEEAFQEFRKEADEFIKVHNLEPVYPFVVPPLE